MPIEHSRPRISAVLNTYNAAEYLDEVLLALAGFDEIVVVDMQSDDATKEIANRHGARIVEHEPCGICEPARNAAIQAATSDWVLIVDADEIVPEALRDYLYETAASSDAPDALKIPRRNSFMGREMKCLYPDYVTRFARKDAIFWPPEIHSTPVVSGRVIEIPAKRKDLALLHLEKNTVASRLEKMMRYSGKEVERRGPKKFRLLAYVFKPFARFFRSFVLKGGWRDGQAGLLWAILEAQYKIATMEQQEELALRLKTSSEGTNP